MSGNIGHFSCRSALSRRYGTHWSDSSPEKLLAHLNPFDLNLTRAYSAPDAFCPRPDLEKVLERACAGRLWTVVDGDRRMGKSSAVIADSVRHGRPILHVDLMGVSSEQEVTERFRWAWQFFVQQAAGGFWKGALPELSATIPGTGVGVKIGGASHQSEPSSWGDVLVAFDKEVGKTGGLLCSAKPAFTAFH